MQHAFPETFFALSKSSGDQDVIDIALRTVRQHLGMEVAYLSEFVDENSVFRAVDAPGLEDIIAPGDFRPLSSVYCEHILAGRLPNVIADTLNEPLAAEMDITKQVPIRSHVSVPVHRLDGSVYGMFCCLSPFPNDTLNDRDLEVMQTFAGLAQEQLQSSIAKRVAKETIRADIDAIVMDDLMHIVLQPIFKIGSDVPSGFEALTRFVREPYEPPNLWFDKAKQIDKQGFLEGHALSLALRELEHLPQETYLTVNASPAAIASGRVRTLLQGQPTDRLVLEVTEHENTQEIQGFDDELNLLAQQGFRIAIDDVGAGYSGLSNILKTSPQVIKLDMDLVRNVDTDIARQALVQALVHFKREIGCTLVAEGVETEAELAALERLGVDMVQGYLLGKPASREAAQAWFA